jgi:hypothetical protein
MSEPQPAPARRWRLWALAFAAGVVLAMAAGSALWIADREPAPTREAAAAEQAIAPAPVIATASSPSQPLPPSGTLELERAAFSASEPVRVSLGLAEPSADESPRPVRLISQPDHRILEIEGALGAGRTAATIEVDPDYLQPGSYLVEVKTTERSHFPLRRYVIVVR